MTAYTLAFVLIRVLAIYYLINAISSVPNVLGTIILISTHRDQLGTSQISTSVETAFYVVVIFTIPYVLWTSAKSIARVLVRPISKESEISIGPLDAPAIAKLIMGLLGVALVAFGLIEISRAVMRLAIYWNDYPHMISDFAPGFVEFIVGLALLFKSDWWPKRATKVVIRRLALKLRTVGTPSENAGDD